MNKKCLAAEKATEYVKDGMVVGLGTGSTVYFAIKKIGERVRDGLDVVGIPTSLATAQVAKKFGIKISTLEKHPIPDLTIDGADEIDKKLNMIKGKGGALLREKIVARASRKVIIVADNSKLVEILGKRRPLPVEVLRFGWCTTAQDISKLGCKVKLRCSGDKPYLTDNKNYILDCKFGAIEHPNKLELALNNIPGVLENGLFIALANMAIIGSEKGTRTIVA